MVRTGGRKGGREGGREGGMEGGRAYLHAGLDLVPVDACDPAFETAAL